MTLTFTQKSLRPHTVSNRGAAKSLGQRRVVRLVGDTATSFRPSVLSALTGA